MKLKNIPIVGAMLSHVHREAKQAAKRDQKRYVRVPKRQNKSK